MLGVGDVEGWVGVEDVEGGWMLRVEGALSRPAVVSTIWKHILNRWSSNVQTGSRDFQVRLKFSFIAVTSLNF